MERNPALWNSGGDDFIRGLLSINEAVVLADVPEKRIRKDIETGLLKTRVVRFGDVRLGDSRLCFNWGYVYIFAAIYGSELLRGKLRKLAFERIDTLWSAGAAGVKSIFPPLACTFSSTYYASAANNWEIDSKCVTNAVRCTNVYIDDCVYLDMERVWVKVKPRIDLYAEGLKRIEEKDGVMSRDAVFKGSRLPVSHIGKMYSEGRETMENILNDYPYLTPDRKSVV